MHAPLRIAHLSDLHFGAHDPALAMAVLDILRQQKVRATAITGDVTQYGRPHEFALAREFLRRLHGPVCMVPGNHDTPYYSLFWRMIAPFRRYRDTLTPTAKEAVRLSGADMTGVNSARGWQWRLNWSLGEVDLAEVGERCRQYRTLSGGKARLFLCHHPLVDRPGVGVPGATRNGVAAARMLADAGVDLLLSGHTHVPHVRPLPGGDGKTHLVEAGTAFSQRTRDVPQSFHIIDVRPDHFAIAQWQAEGPRYQPVQEWTCERRTRS